MRRIQTTFLCLLFVQFQRVSGISQQRQRDTQTISINLITSLPFFVSRYLRELHFDYFYSRRLIGFPSVFLDKQTRLHSFVTAYLHRHCRLHGSESFLCKTPDKGDDDDDASDEKQRIHLIKFTPE